MTNKHTVCLAGYHWPHDKRKKIMKCSIAVIDLETDKLVEVVELDKDTSIDFAQKTAVAIAKKYDCKLFVSTKPVPYEKCECCKKGYHISTVTSENLAEMPELTGYPDDDDDDDDDDVDDVAFTGFEAAVIACYNRSVLDESLLSEMMESYRDAPMDILSGKNCEANDGLDAVEIVVKILSKLPEQPVLPESDDDWSADDQKNHGEYYGAVLDEFFTITDERFGWA